VWSHCRAAHRNWGENLFTAKPQSTPRINNYVQRKSNDFLCQRYQYSPIN
jgi:hypothetical protein